MSQDILGVLQSLDHLQIGRLHGGVEWVGAPLTTLVHVGDYLSFRA